MIEQLLTHDAPPACADVPGMPVKPEIGSCSQAEEFFLEIAHGRVRRGGRVNVIVAANGEPLMLEKMNLGESHSAIVIAPIRIHGVGIPPGSLCALDHLADAAPGSPTRARTSALRRHPTLPALRPDTLRRPSSQVCAAASHEQKGQRRVHRPAVPDAPSSASRQR